MGRHAWADARGTTGKTDARRIKRRFASLLICSTALCSPGLFVSTAVHAQARVAEAVSFDIPAQPLRSAINAFTRATGWEVGFTSQAVDGKRSRAIGGMLAPGQALQALLADTGLHAAISGPSTAAIVEIGRAHV